MKQRYICENTNDKNVLLNCIDLNANYNGNDSKYYKKVISHNKELVKIQKGNDYFLIDTYFTIIGVPNKEETNFILGEYNKCKDDNLHCYTQYIEVLKQQDLPDIELIKNLYQKKYEELIIRKDCSLDSFFFLREYAYFLKENNIKTSLINYCEGNKFKQTGRIMIIN